MLNPASRPHPGRQLLPAAPAGRRGQRLPGRPGRGRSSTDGVPVGVEREGVVLAPGRGLGARARTTPASRTRGSPGSRRSALHVMTYVAYGPLGPEAGAGRLDGPARLAAARPDPLRATSRSLDTDLNLFPNKDAVFFPEPVPGPGRRARVRDAAPADVGPRLVPRRRGRAPAGRRRPTTGPASGSPTSRSRTVRARPRRAGPAAATTGWSRCPSTPSRQLKIGAGPPPIRVAEGWLLIHHGVSGAIGRRAASRSSRRCTTRPAR